MSKLFGWADRHWRLLLSLIFAVVVIPIVIFYFGFLLDPNYCDSACRVAQYRSAIVQECVQLELYTLDDCIRMNK